MDRIAYVTGSRAEYGIVKRLLLKLQNDPTIDFSLIVTAMHLDPKYGSTVDIIEQDGLHISAKIDIELDSKNNQTIIHSMAECLAKFGDYFQQHKFNAVIVLGDRYEMLSIAIAAAMHNIPIIHLHGGEQTLGNYDEFIRHCITKMAKLHLTSTEEYRNRVIQLGEVPESVFNVGSLGAENSLLLDFPNKEMLFSKKKIIDKPYFLVVFHPETLSNYDVLEQLETLFSALDKFKDKYQFVFIGSNADTHSDKIFTLMKEYCELNNFSFFTSVKPEEYLALVKYSKGLIGNSSSGLLEAPSCGVGTLNIGHRQRGRVRGRSVIDVQVDENEIIWGITKLVSSEFQRTLSEIQNPYYQENAMEKAYQCIVHFVKNETGQPKSFYDLSF
ncbi:UDP-N-acetylglucosamine 2-epimerase [Lonepinella sp. BR2919]|uniref:UDP-N-acetylglucosamine 2-epimerase n=1 Tax=unclassified Lonepinella TaxID=2642006 RepID=UPI003F6E2FAF